MRNRGICVKETEIDKVWVNPYNTAASYANTELNGLWLYIKPRNIAWQVCIMSVIANRSVTNSRLAKASGVFYLFIHSFIHFSCFVMLG